MNDNSMKRLVPRMRTINNAVAEIKSIDPANAISPYYVRQLVLNGQITCKLAGRKQMIDLDELIDYMYSMTGGSHSA